MNFRTDLALERKEYIKEKEPDGVISKEESIKNIKITTIEITNKNGERLIGKPEGKYITVEADGFIKNPSVSDAAIEVAAEKIRELLPEGETFLVAGLGNDQITSDALGPKSASMILATRHIKGELAKSIGMDGVKSVAAIVPGVLGKTGIEAKEIIEGAVKKTKPDALIVIDALAARKLSRLGTTVQMCNTGISPGSGVGNSRGEISEKTLGIPVIAVGVPTVVDGVTMALDVFEKAGFDTEHFSEKELRNEKAVMVTPKEIDLVTERASVLLAMAINLALFEGMDKEDIFELVR